MCRKCYYFESNICFQNIFCCCKLSKLIHLYPFFLCTPACVNHSHFHLFIMAYQYAHKQAKFGTLNLLNLEKKY